MLEKRALVFIHGFLGAPADWHGIAFNHFHEYPIHFYQIPGHGLKPLPTTTTLEDLKQFIKPLGKVHLIGYSMGGRIAMHFKTLFPNLIDKLVIISSQLGLKESEKKERLAWDSLWAKKLLDMPFDAFLNEWYNMPLFSNPLLTPLIRKQREHHNKHDLATVFKLLSPAKLPNLWLKPPSFFENTLFFFGKNDVKYSRVAKKLQSIKRAKTIEIANAFHSLLLEQPDKLALFMKTFLEKN